MARVEARVAFLTDSAGQEPRRGVADLRDVAVVVVCNDRRHVVRAVRVVVVVQVTPHTHGELLGCRVERRQPAAQKAVGPESTGAVRGAARASEGYGY